MRIKNTIFNNPQLLMNILFPVQWYSTYILYSEYFGGDPTEFFVHGVSTVYPYISL